jgi:hypothetical protein
MDLATGILALPAMLPNFRDATLGLTISTRNPPRVPRPSHDRFGLAEPVRTHARATPPVPA